MRFFPQKTTFFDLFDRHSDHLVSISHEVRDLFSLFDRVEERQARIKDLEHQCDEITHEVFTQMHATFVTPLDKEDLAAIASGLDDVADYIDAAAVRVILYRIPETTPEAGQLAELLVQVTEVLRGAVACLRNNRDREKIAQAFQDIHRLENESDTAYRGALGRLFNTPGSDPIMILKWKEIYERLEMAVDKCEDVANVVEAVHIKYS
jgi:predicted phosphate transport protein (TIGR00153 family)